MRVTLRPATNSDRAAIESLVFGVLAEYGLAPDPNGTDARTYKILRQNTAAKAEPLMYSCSSNHRIAHNTSTQGVTVKFEALVSVPAGVLTLICPVRGATRLHNRGMRDLGWTEQ